MTPIILALIAMIGVWYFQDGLASIAYYPKEHWRWNHTARAIRIVLGIFLITVGLAYL